MALAAAHGRLRGTGGVLARSVEAYGAYDRNMREDSPTHFVKFKRKRTVYEGALELVRHVHRVLDHAQARMYLKERLDRHATALVMELSRAEGELQPSLCKRRHRAALAVALDLRAELDIVAAQQASPDVRVAAAQACVTKLCDELAKLSGVPSRSSSYR